MLRLLHLRRFADRKTVLRVGRRLPMQLWLCWRGSQAGERGDKSSQIVSMRDDRTVSSRSTPTLHHDQATSSEECFVLSIANW